MALNFDLTEEQNLLRQAVRDFAEKEIAPVIQELDEKEQFSVELTLKMGTWPAGVLCPEKYGGSNMGYISYIIAVEELARVDGSQAATIAAGNLWNRAHLLLRQRRAEGGMVPRLCSGKMLAAFGSRTRGRVGCGGSKTKAELGGIIGHQRVQDFYHQLGQSADRRNRGPAITGRKRMESES